MSEHLSEHFAKAFVSFFTTPICTHKKVQEIFTSSVPILLSRELSAGIGAFKSRKFDRMSAQLERTTNLVADQSEVTMRLGEESPEVAKPDGNKKRNRHDRSCRQYCSKQ